MNVTWNNEFWSTFFDFLGSLTNFLFDFVHSPFGCLVFVSISIWTSIVLIRLIMEVIK